MAAPKVVTIIPAYNEEKTILEVIRNLKVYSDLIVIDDFSTDNTHNLIKSEEIILIRNPYNLGYEKSIKVGLFKAIQLNYDYAITFDADGEHLSRELTKFLNFIENGYDLILGNRSYVNRFSEKLAKIFFFKTWGIKDPFCGLKGYNLNKVKNFDYFERYESVGVDLSLSFIEKGYKFINVDIDVSKRDDNSKFGNFFFANFKIMRSIVKSYLYHWSWK